MKGNVLVTGASKGIGKYICKTLLKENYRVIGVARSIADLEAAKAELSAYGPMEVFSFDLSKGRECADFVAKVEAQCGPVDILVNNAAMEIYEHFEDFSEAQIEQVISTNLVGPMILAKHMIPSFRQRGGHIICVASLAGKKGLPYNSVYSASKAGMLMWMDALRMELHGSKVRTTTVLPGYISDAGLFHSTGMDKTPILGVSSPQDVADAILVAIKKQPKEIIVNKGATRLLLALGQLFPSLGDFVMRTLGVPQRNQKHVIEKNSSKNQKQLKLA